MSRARRDCFDAHKKVDETGRIYLVCYLCSGRIDPAREKWEAEHTLRKTLNGSDHPSNVLPAHEACHKPKTAKDIAENSKGKRVSERHFGIKRSRGFYKPKGMKFDWGSKRYVRETDQ